MYIEYKIYRQSDRQMNALETKGRNMKSFKMKRSRENIIDSLKKMTKLYKIKWPQ